MTKHPFIVGETFTKSGSEYSLFIFDVHSEEYSGVWLVAGEVSPNDFSIQEVYEIFIENKDFSLWKQKEI